MLNGSRIAAGLLACLLCSPLVVLAQPPPDRIVTSLGWDRCAGDGWNAARTFSCDTNTGEDVLVVSATLLDQGRSGILAIDAFVDIAQASGSLPAWWSLDGCRVAGALLSMTPPVGATNCVPLFDAVTTNAGLGVYYAAGRPYLRAYLMSLEPVSMSAAQEYFLFRIRVRHTKVTGAGSCAGCQAPMCLGLGRMNMEFSGSTKSFAGQGQNAVSWQGGYVAGYPTLANPVSEHGIPFYENRLDCTLAPVPAQGRTWGMIKALYR